MHKLRVDNKKFKNEIKNVFGLKISTTIME